jgi:hypothetical protein
MVSATGNFFLLIIIQTPGEINAKAQRRKGAKAQSGGTAGNEFFAASRLCVFALKI